MSNRWFRASLLEALAFCSEAWAESPSDIKERRVVRSLAQYKCHQKMPPRNQLLDPSSHSPSQSLCLQKRAQHTPFQEDWPSRVHDCNVSNSLAKWRWFSEALVERDVLSQNVGAINQAQRTVRLNLHSSKRQTSGLRRRELTKPKVSTSKQAGDHLSPVKIL